MDNNRIVNREFIVKENCYFDDLPFYYDHNQIAHCTYCTRYFAGCFIDGTFRSPWDPCHDIKLVFTDGACSNNGQVNATSGMGIVMGTAPEYQWSIPIDDSVDPRALRTSQRAELLAAIRGLEELEKEAQESYSPSLRKHSDSLYPAMVLRGRSSWCVTDSHYVAEGITKWFPQWQVCEVMNAINRCSVLTSSTNENQRRNSWRTSQGVPPTNLDLFCRLDSIVTDLELIGLEVGFWKIGREDNHEADALAKTAARISV
ncbi:ribonuclease H-like domain-containing protein [Armillaria borealis]|uniref:ribonuclease H n=1 Tax=Armillaria borealis TaxID=47425 RepID=A0AA39IF94_9AGAR|nr:ribonuclease H-like domain-containing protein [Armillaria borealis]